MIFLIVVGFGVAIYAASELANWLGRRTYRKIKAEQQEIHDVEEWLKLLSR